MHNYYGGKGQILLALVDMCDDEIRDSIDRIAGEEPHDAEAVINAVLDEITTSSLEFLAHHVWRHAIATSITREDVEFGIGFSQAHSKFIASISRLLRALMNRGVLPATLDCQTCASVLYKIQHSLFIELIGDQDPDMERYRASQRIHVGLVLGSLGNADNRVASLEAKSSI